MRIALVAQMDQVLGIHYALAFERAGHDVFAVHTEAPQGKWKEVEEMRRVEVLTPYAARPKDTRREFLAWALADRARGPLRPLAPLARAAFGMANRRAVAAAADLVAAREPDAVFAMWGQNGYAELWALQRRARRDFPLFQDWNTYPLGDELVGTRGVNAVDRALAERLDGRVHASRRQMGFMKQRMDLRRGLDLVFPDGFSALAMPRKPLPLASELDGEPHLLYHGTWVVKPGGQDDVAPQLRAVADAGIHLHFPARGDTPQHPRLHPYPLFSLQQHVRGEVFRHGTQCDACLVTYHVPRPVARFQNYLPTRFLSGIACGLPIAMPRGLMPACEDFLAEHHNGFTFRDVAELKAALQDRERMAGYRKRAKALMEAMTLEARMPQLEQAFTKARDAMGGA